MTGVVEYSGVNEEATSSAPYAIEELVTLSDETLSLAPNEQKEITLTVRMPSESFDGILAGDYTSSKPAVKNFKECSKPISQRSSSIASETKNQTSRQRSKLKKPIWMRSIAVMSSS